MLQSANLLPRFLYNNPCISYKLFTGYICVSITHRQ